MHLLIQRISRDEEVPKGPPPKTSKKLLALLNRLNTRSWLPIVEGQLIEAIHFLRREVKFIEHLPHCRICKIELQLDVERYNGNHSTWYLGLENSEYIEEQYPDCPKEENYKIGSYWTGSSDETVRFILERAKWAYKIMGKQILTARQMLKLVRTWNFSKEYTARFNRLYDKLARYEVTLP